MTRYKATPSKFYDVDNIGDAPWPNATETDPKVRKLLGPNGEVLRTFSDRPPVGFA